MKFAIYCGYIFYKTNKNWFSVIKVPSDSWVRENFKYNLANKKVKAFEKDNFSKELIIYHNSKITDACFLKTLKSCVNILIKNKLIDAEDVIEYRKFCLKKENAKKAIKATKVKAIEIAYKNGLQTQNELLNELKALRLHNKINIKQFKVDGFYPKLANLEKSPKFWR